MRRDPEIPNEPSAIQKSAPLLFSVDAKSTLHERRKVDAVDPQGRISPESRPILIARFGRVGSRFCELVPESASRMRLGAFRGGNPLERIVAKPRKCDGPALSVCHIRA